MKLPDWPLLMPVRKLYRVVDRLYRRGLLAWSIRGFRRQPPGTLPSRRLLRVLRKGWGNEVWSASEELLIGLIREAWKTPGPVLECGSGLSTLLLGAIGMRVGWEVWTLEHDAFWAEHVRQALCHFGMTNVHLLHAPLRDYGAFHWYDVPPEMLPACFSLVLCDGPPGNTPGGRYGLLPVLGHRLSPTVVILLDDAGRPEEQAIAHRWTAELGGTMTIEGVQKPYARIEGPG